MSDFLSTFIFIIMYSGFQYYFYLKEYIIDYSEPTKYESMFFWPWIILGIGKKKY